jgi:two-component system chemotaxis response regulator CheB
VIGVVLSGGLDDGTAGLRGIKMCGGVTVVQEPADALVGEMPASALRHATVDYCRPAAALAPLIAELVAGVPPPEAFVPRDAMRTHMEVEAGIAMKATARRARRAVHIHQPRMPRRAGAAARPTAVRYRCHTGHSFTADSLPAGLSDTTEQAIWNVIRSLQETAMLLGHLAEHWREVEPATARKFARQAEVAQARSELIRKTAAEHQVLSEEKVAARQ